MKINLSPPFSFASYENHEMKNFKDRAVYAIEKENHFLPLTNPQKKISSRLVHLRLQK